MATPHEQTLNSLMQLKPEEMLLMGQKQPKLCPHSLCQLFRWKQEQQNMHLPEPVSFSFRVCTRPISSLRRTTVSSLRVNIPADGKYLFLRTLEKPVYGTCIPTLGRNLLMVVEDHRKETTICCLYGYIHLEDPALVDQALTQNAVFILKEPCLKFCPPDYFAVVVGSPSDFIIVDCSHDLAKEAQELGWQKPLLENQTVQPEPGYALRCKAFGNNFYKSQKYIKALEAYRVALKYTIDPELVLTLHLNLALAYIKREFFETAIKHVEEALNIHPNNEKALYRAGIAHYKLRQYDKARRYFQTLVLMNPMNKEGVSHLQRSEDRHREDQGLIDIYVLYKARRESPSMPIDFGCYVGPIEHRPPSGKGRGIFAKEDITPGTLIVAEKSIVVNFEPFDLISGLTKIILNTVCAVYKNPKNFGNKLYSLSSGNCEMDMEQNLFCNESEQKEVKIDVYRLMRILFVNTFNADEQMVDFFPSVWQLYHLSSGFNHSCVPNAMFEVYNDVITIRTTSFIKKRDEIFVSYISNMLPHTKRKNLFKTLNLSCRCAYCKLDSAEHKNTLERRNELQIELGSILDPDEISPNRKMKLQLLTKKLEENYKNRPAMRFHLVPAYLALANLVDRRVPNGITELMLYVDRGLKNAGLSVEVMLDCAEHSNKHLPNDAMVSDYLLEFAALVIDAELASGRLYLVRKWVKVVLLLERVLRGANLHMIRDRFQALPEVSQAVAKYNTV